MGVLSALSPYMLWLKIGLAVALFAGGVVTGCQVQERRDALEIEKKDRALENASRDLLAASTALRQVSAATRAEAERAREQAEAGQAAVEQARRDAEAYRAQLGDIRADLEDAKRDPDCRRILELPTCAVLR